MQTNILTEQEQALVNLLGQCFNAFKQLPIYHPSDMDEFVRAIHAAQNIVLARPGYASQPHLGILWNKRLQDNKPKDATEGAYGLYYDCMDLLLKARSEVPGHHNLQWRINSDIRQEITTARSKQGSMLTMEENGLHRIFTYPIVWMQEVPFIELADLDGNWKAHVQKMEGIAK